MRGIVIGLLLLGLGMLGYPGGQDGECLKVEASVRPRWLSRGQEGKILLKIRLDKGVVINAQPSFIIECSPSRELVFPKNFFTASDLEVEIVQEEGMEYLDLSKPIEIPFTVNLEAKRGNHTFEGKIKYFAFSKKENWCLKSSARFRATFYTRSTRVRKKGSLRNPGSGSSYIHPLSRYHPRVSRRPSASE
ncbi:MAG: hypothetical protein ACE5LV_01080 [Candidatus Aminicenantales bacterium]